MWNIENDFKVKIGGNIYIKTPTIISYKGQSIFTLKRRESDGQLGIDFDVYDKNRQKIATVRNGNVVDGDAQNYEIIKAADHYQVKEKRSNRILCEIKKKANASPAELDVSAELYMPDGLLISATPNGTNIGGVSMKGNIFENCGTAISIN